MTDLSIVLPSQPKIKSEDDFKGIYEIDGLYPGYGYTLGNSLRRIILSSMLGVAITSVKIAGASHEFSVLDGIKEDVVTILLYLKKVRLQTNTAEPQTLRLKVKGAKEVTASDIELSGDIVILNPELVIAHITDKSAELDIELTIEKGLGYVPKEILQKEKVDIGTIAVDAIFTPVRRVSYEVENMRVGDRTDFNRLRVLIETDGTITPKETLEQSIRIMIEQLKAISGFKEEEVVLEDVIEEETEENAEENKEHLKTRIEDIDLSARTLNALQTANIRTVGGLARKSKADIMEIEGLGAKGIKEIESALEKFDITLS